MLCHPAFFLSPGNLLVETGGFHTGNLVPGKPSRYYRPPTLPPVVAKARMRMIVPVEVSVPPP